MTPIDERLLQRARETAASLAEAERQCLLARADHHTAVRRLHLGGASLREIGQALGLSHQRVQQIVNDAGGSWWQRIWRNRNARDAVCTMCERPPSEVDKLVAGPDVYLCDACIARAEQAMARGRSGGAGAAAGVGADVAPAKAGSRACCSFCSKQHSAERKLVCGPNANVCCECLLVCRDIIDHAGVRDPEGATA